MTRRYAPLAAFAAVLALACAAAPASAVSVGETAPAFTLTDLAGQEHSLADYQGKVVVLEWVNPECPFSDRHAREKTMASLADRHGEVVWLGINSTNPGHANYLEPAEHQSLGRHRTASTTRSSTTPPATSARPTAPPPRRTCSSSTSRARSPTTAPSTTTRRGRKKPAERTNYVDGGLDAHEAGNAIAPASTKPYGCSVKY